MSYDEGREAFRRILGYLEDVMDAGGYAAFARAKRQQAALYFCKLFRAHASRLPTWLMAQIVSFALAPGAAGLCLHESKCQSRDVSLREWSLLRESKEGEM